MGDRLKEIRWRYETALSVGARLAVECSDLAALLAVAEAAAEVSDLLAFLLDGTSHADEPAVRGLAAALAPLTEEENRG